MVDDNPMSRPCDRLRATARVWLVVILLAGCVGAVFAGWAAYDQQRAIDRLDAKYGYRVDARIVARISSSGAQDNAVVPHTYRLAWRDAAGRRHVGTFASMTTSTRNGSMPLWIDHRGEASMTRHTGRQATAVGVLTGVSLAAGAAAVGTVAYLAFVFVLDRRRAAAWAAEWAVVEPRWRREVLDL
ncbi:MAG: hypothetical protein GEV07_06880 [Streptosporangiales bacterium]|nr:hypothetical protein [Streptosporangiales bacterium]